MQIKLKDKEGYGYYEVIFSRPEDSDLLEKIKLKAKKISNLVNINDPSGIARDDETIIIKNIAGLLAEESIKLILNKFIDENNINAEILESKYTTSLDQVDIKIKIKNKIKTIEVRSSFGYKTTFERMFEGAFSIIGNYTTENKSKELEKDYYLFVLHFYHPSELKNKLDTEITTFVIAGASKETLNEIGEIKSLKQDAAKYKIINPIIKAPDILVLLNKIFETN